MNHQRSLRSAWLGEQGSSRSTMESCLEAPRLLEPVWAGRAERRQARSWLHAEEVRPVPRPGSWTRATPDRAPALRCGGGHPILVIGGTGQIGGCLVRQGRRRYGDGAVLSTGCSRAEGDRRRLDLGDPGIAEKVRALGPGALAIVGAFAHVDGCEDDPGRAVTVNVEGPRRVARVAAENGLPLVYFSTDYLFDGEDGPYDEEARPAPLSVYGRSKLEGERAVGEACPWVLIVRTTVVYSYDPDSKNFLMQVVGRLSSGEEMTVPRDQWSTPSYAPDVADCVLDLMESRVAGVINVAGPDLMDRLELARLIAEGFELDPRLLQGTDTSSLAQRAHRPLRGGLQTELLQRTLGRFPTSVRDGIRAARLVQSQVPG